MATHLGRCPGKWGLVAGTGLLWLLHSAGQGQAAEQQRVTCDFCTGSLRACEEAAWRWDLWTDPRSSWGQEGPYKGQARAFHGTAEPLPLPQSSSPSTQCCRLDPLSFPPRLHHPGPGQDGDWLRGYGTHSRLPAFGLSWGMALPPSTLLLVKAQPWAGSASQGTSRDLLRSLPLTKAFVEH